MDYIINLEKKSNNKTNISNEIKSKEDSLDLNNKKLSESNEENYNDICNNISQNSENIKVKENDENEKLKEQINKEIEDMYQLSLKNSQNKKSNKNNINKNIQLIKPMENSNYNFFDEDEFKFGLWRISPSDLLNT